MMPLGISIFLLLLPFIAGQATWSASSSVDDTTIAAIHNKLHLPLTQIQHALESQNQMREELTRVSNLSATVEDTAITAVRNILHQPLTQIQDAIEPLNQMREEVTSLASQVSDLSVTDRTNLCKDCSQLYQAGYRKSGVYVMHILDAGLAIPISIYCDMETDGGGWLVIQRRQDGSVDFYRDWISYAEGFGNITGEFWLGNKLIHLLTDRKPQQLRVDLHDHEGHTAYAKYGYFYVGPEMTKFALGISGYSGTAGDSMAYNNNRMFSTKDQDNDLSAGSCAIMRKGAWWYTECSNTNPNGLCAQTGSHSRTQEKDHVNWYPWRALRYSLKFIEMKIRPQDF